VSRSLTNERTRNRPPFEEKAGSGRGEELQSVLRRVPFPDSETSIRPFLFATCAESNKVSLYVAEVTVELTFHEQKRTAT
jgi:hypothetical protein